MDWDATATVLKAGQKSMDISSFAILAQETNADNFMIVGICQLDNVGGSQSMLGTRASRRPLD